MSNNHNQLRTIYPRTEFSTASKVTLVLVLLLLLTLIVILNLPLEALGATAGVVLVQAQLLTLVSQLSGYVVVGMLGAIVGIAELTAAFQTYPRAALRTRWARILIGVNVVAAILALGITRLTMPEMNQVLQVILVGFGFQSLIRTRFVLAKQIGPSANDDKDIAVNVGWIYDQFQTLCRTQIDLELMSNRRTAVTELIQHYPSLTELYDIAYYTVIARATLTAEEEETRLNQLEKLIDPSAPENLAKVNTALLILENGGPGYVNLLLDQAATTESVQSAATPSQERLVAMMMDRYSLDELVKLTDELTSSENVQTWVREAAKPEASTTMTNRKAAICHMLIQQAGLETVQRAMQQDL